MREGAEEAVHASERGGGGGGGGGAREGRRRIWAEMAADLGGEGVEEAVEARE